MNLQRKGRFQLLLLVLVFVLPVLAVVMLHWADWRPEGKSYGELVRPPRSLAFPVLQTFRHEPFDAVAWQGHWHLVYVTAQECSESCRSDLHMLRQLHASLGKEIDRLQRVWIIAGPPPAEIATVASQYQDLVILPQSGAFATQFDLPYIQAADSGRIYVVDPLGHLVMSYPPNSNPYGIRKDLMRLLSYSWAG
jgi:cytochrome oxidase Cu insertion factor (SCO1/SenC/PrrC family)